MFRHPAYYVGKVAALQKLAVPLEYLQEQVMRPDISEQQRQDLRQQITNRSAELGTMDALDVPARNKRTKETDALRQDVGKMNRGSNIANLGAGLVPPIQMQGAHQDANVARAERLQAAHESGYRPPVNPDLEHRIHQLHLHTRDANLPAPAPAPAGNAASPTKESPAAKGTRPDKAPAPIQLTPSKIVQQPQAPAPAGPQNMGHPGTQAGRGGPPPRQQAAVPSAGPAQGTRTTVPVGGHQPLGATRAGVANPNTALTQMQPGMHDATQVRPAAPVTGNVHPAHVPAEVTQPHFNPAPRPTLDPRDPFAAAAQGKPDVPFKGVNVPGTPGYNRQNASYFHGDAPGPMQGPQSTGGTSYRTPLSEQGTAITKVPEVPAGLRDRAQVGSAPQAPATQAPAAAANSARFNQFKDMAGQAMGNKWVRRGGLVAGGLAAGAGLHALFSRPDHQTVVVR